MSGKFHHLLRKIPGRMILPSAPALPLLSSSRLNLLSRLPWLSSSNQLRKIHSTRAGAIPDWMEGVQLEKPGDLSNLIWNRKLPIPQPGLREVRIKVKACSVCHRDILDRKGAFPFIKHGIIPGHEVAGIVEKVGEGVTQLKPGDRVVTLHWAPCGQCEHCLSGKTTQCSLRERSFLGLTNNGGYAQYMVSGHSAFVLVPAGFSAVEASTVMCTFGTFWHAAISRGRLQPGESVLISGASGGVGSAAVQISKALGCKVFAVTSNPEKEQFLKDLGADEVLVSTDGKFNKDPRLASGVDMSFEAVGAPTFNGSLRSLKNGGRLVLIGNVTAASVPLSLGFPIINSLEIIGSDSCTAVELRKCLEFMLRTGIRPKISKVLPLKEFAEAQTLLETRAIQGRVVLKCDEDGADGW